MPAPLLFVDNRGVAGACTAYRYQGASPAQVGDTFGVRFTTFGDVECPRHGAVQYRGNLYALSQDGVYVKDDPTVNTGAWTQAIVFTNPIASFPRNSGLHVVYIADAPWLVVVFGDAATSTFRWAKFDGTTWTQASSGTVVTNLNNMQEVVVYRNVIHMFGHTTTSPKTITFDPASESFATVANDNNVSNGENAACVFNDRLFMVYRASGPLISLQEFTGGAWVAIPGSVPGFAPQTVTAGVAKWALFTDGTFLYGMVSAPTAAGWRCLQWDNTLGTPTDITAAVLPAGLKAAADGGTYPGANGTARMVACLDQDTDPAIADIWLFQAQDGNSGTPFALWQWNGPAALITQVDSGGNVGHAIPSGLNHGGEHIWTAGELDIALTGKAAVVGGERLKWRGYGAPGAADKKVKFFFNKEGEPALLQCTLTAVTVLSGSPAGSPSVAANEVTGVDADPTVEYAATWDIGTDGVLAGDRVQVKAQLSI